MPRKPIDYSKTIIYKFVCKDLDVKDLYVGHTTNWIKRKSCHKDACINSNCKSYNLKVYKMMRENGNWNNWDMIEIEKYPCNDEREASSRERYWYEQLHAELNMIRPLRTEEERKEYKKEYHSRPEVKERQKEYQKEYRSSQKRKEYIKDYCQKNKEYIKQQKKDYHSRPETIKRRNEKINCDCGGKYTKCNIRLHERSKKHQQYIESLN